MIRISLSFPFTVVPFAMFLCLVFAALIAGCSNKKDPQQEPATTTETAAESGKQTGIFGKTTQEIGKFDPNASHVVVDSTIQKTTPGLGALEAYGPVVQKVAGLAVQQRVAHFHATNGRYPTYEEFMEQIVNNAEAPLRLPVLPGKNQYYYHEADHTIVVVDPNPSAEQQPE